MNLVKHLNTYNLDNPTTNNYKFPTINSNHYKLEKLPSL